MVLVKGNGWGIKVSFIGINNDKVNLFLRYGEISLIVIGGVVKWYCKGYGDREGEDLGYFKSYFVVIIRKEKILLIRLRYFINYKMYFCFRDMNMRKKDIL